MIDYDALMAFATFTEHMNFTHAAAELFISQPALHKKVKKLSEQVDSPLYIRRGRELVLTRSGRLLAAHARQVATMTEHTLARLREQERLGTVVLTSGPGAFYYLLGPAIQAARQGPYELSLMSMHSPKTVEALLDVRAHVALGVFAHETPDLERAHWRRVSQMIVVPKTHRLASSPYITPDQLANESLVLATHRGLHRLGVEKTLEEHGVDWRGATEVTGWDVMVQFVSYGMGVTIINDFVTLPDDLIGIPAPAFATVDYEVAIRRDLQHSGAWWLRDLLLEFAREHESTPA